MTSRGQGRSFLKGDLWEKWQELETDQRKGLPPPPPQTPHSDGAEVFALIPPSDMQTGAMPLIDAIRSRESRRSYSEDHLTLEELSFLLWAAQGVRRIVGSEDRPAVYRTVPSAGARHPLETYVAISRVAGLQPGLYRYLSLEHRLCLLHADDALTGKIGEACNDQAFVGRAAVVFIWTAVPYRTEWRYSIISPKIIALDAGHACQNLYLAVEAIGAGTCAVGAYHQRKLDALLGVDGEEEFAIYVAPVGRIG